MDQIEADIKVTVELAWQVFKPDRPDACFAGQCGAHLAEVLMPRAGVREVYASKWNTSHYSEKHGVELDIEVAEAILPGVLANPVMVCEGDRGELLFIGHYSEKHYLVVPVKPLPGELWLCTMYVTNKTRFAKKAIKRGTVLYSSEG